jgi:hypothetical protein
MPNAKKVLSGVLPALFLFLVTLAAPFPAQAQAQNPAGHWDGHVKLPSGPLEVHLDLKYRHGSWSGDIVIPTESTRMMPVTGVKVSGRRVSFGVEMRGGPRFDGKLDKEGAELDGKFREAGYDYPFRLVRAGGGGGGVRGPGD